MIPPISPSSSVDNDYNSRSNLMDTIEACYWSPNKSPIASTEEFNQIDNIERNWYKR
jgi:hypothetical protein